MRNKEESGGFYPKRDYRLFIGVFVVAVFVLPLATIALIGLCQPYGLSTFLFVRHFFAAGIHLIVLNQWSYDSAMGWSRVGLWPEVTYAFYFVLGISNIIALWLAGLISRPPAKIRHIIGPRFFGFNEGPRKAEKAIRKALKREVRFSGGGICIHPNVAISRDRETRHLLVIGSTGGGKTSIILPIIRQAQNRGDMVVLFDNKGDFTSKLSGMILAPWDKRCVGWDVGRDIENKQDAETLAARLVSDGGNDPMWARGARMILVAFIVKAQREKPKVWDFSDIVGDLESADSNKVKEIVDKIGRAHV